MLRSRLHAIVLAAFVLLGACATAGSSGPPAHGPITQAELQEIPATSVFDAVRRLRPQWTGRLAGGFLDGQPVSPAQLRQEPLLAIEEIRLLSAEEATARYGVRSLSGNYLDVVRRR